jgi:hypothetical protein
MGCRLGCAVLLRESTSPAMHPVGPGIRDSCCRGTAWNQPSNQITPETTMCQDSARDSCRFSRGRALAAGLEPTLQRRDVEADAATDVDAGQSILRAPRAIGETSRMDGEELRGRATVEEEGPIVQDTSPWRASHPSRKRACVAGWPLVYSAPGRFCEASAPERKTSTQVLHRRSEFVKTFLLRSVVIIMLVSGVSRCRAPCTRALDRM